MRWTLLSAALVLGLASPVIAQEEAEHEEHAEHAAAPESGLRAELIQDVEQLEQKYMGLARAMDGHYDWRPGEGVRSVGEVFGHVANANFMIPGMAGVEAEMTDENFEQADPETILEALEHSFRHAKHSIAAVPDEELDAPTKLFGQDATKRQVLQLLVTHMHEHLGQSIAYARTNGVAPPWSAGGE
ncbi:MAG: hypothetical protein GWM90_10260 [Gemmatimonadetes bacterium]|nr:DinB family protein [Gemmatimonadota bacterium]NIQ54340.1 DinB family protein [Gemmatimonadota bacterium]NIU74550.1 hypothetical protein [Gammaproteobacteria bacterium]NIX44485.1 hypothetical protein [Gemmatimonadota bacterium]NIY08715.1 hypothetical protein [Gemmatimonadota bacterium]